VELEKEIERERDSSEESREKRRKKEKKERMKVGNKSPERRLNLNGSWHKGHSHAYNTPFYI